MEYSNKKKASHSHVVKKVHERIRDVISLATLLPHESPLIIGVSGGADSISLLHILSFLFPDTRRIAVYVDHGLRPDETVAEKKLVQEQAAICGAQFETAAVDVQAEKKRHNCSLEEAARTLRYQVLEKFRATYQAAAIAVGHTADDQAEEILLRLIRGSSTTGLSGMELQRDHIIRPLLHETKDSLLSYLKAQDIPYCQDSSNADTRFLRNKIRLELLPTLENEYNQSMRQTLLQTATILADEDKLLSTITKRAFKKLVHGGPEHLYLHLADFAEEPLAIQRRILDTICWTLRSKPSFKKIESLLSLAASQNHKEIHLTDGLRAVRQGKRIFFHRPSLERGYRGRGVIPKTFSPITLPCPGKYPVSELNRTLLVTKCPFSPDHIKIPDIQMVDAAKIVFPLLLRPPQAGDFFHPLNAPGRKKISRFFSDQKIPVMERDHYPVLLSDDGVIAIAGQRIDHAFRITETTEHVLLLQWQTDEDSKLLY